MQKRPGCRWNFPDPGAIGDEEITFVVIAARFKGRWIVIRHRDRATWEIPGGHRESGEELDRAARRELFEETGAADFRLLPVGPYRGERRTSHPRDAPTLPRWNRSVPYPRWKSRRSDWWSGSRIRMSRTRRYNRFLTERFWSTLANHNMGATIWVKNAASSLGSCAACCVGGVGCRAPTQERLVIILGKYGNGIGHRFVDILGRADTLDHVTYLDTPVKPSSHHRGRAARMPFPPEADSPRPGKCSESDPPTRTESLRCRQWRRPPSSPPDPAL